VPEVEVDLSQIPHNLSPYLADSGILDLSWS